MGVYWRRWRVPLLIVASVAILLVGKLTGFLDDIDAEKIRTFIEDAGPWGIVFFVAAFAIGSLIHVPGTVFVVASALVYGKTTGFLVSLFGSVISVSVTFWVVRWAGGQALAEIKRPFIRRILSHLDAAPIQTVFLLRTVLWVNPALNYALAMSRIRFRDYVLGSFLGLAAPIAGITFLFDLFLGRVGG